MFFAPPPKSLAKNQKGQQQVVNYILRYAGRPVMAQSRIEANDKDTKIIQYWYQPHDGDEVVHITENIFVFMGKLIQHIFPTNFKTIRHAGIYASQDKKYREKKKRYEQKKHHHNIKR